MSNGSLTCTINEIWDIFENGSLGSPAQPARKNMANILVELARNEDCDMHNLNPTMKRLAEYGYGVET